MDSGTGSNSRPQHRQTLHETPLCFSTDGSKDDQSTLDYYRGLYDHLVSSSFASSERIGSVEVVPANSLPDDAPYSPNGPSSDVALLRLSSILAFTSSRLDDDGNVVLVPRGNKGVGIYSDVAGALLAMHHFNNGIGSIVTEIAGMNETCPIRFVSDYYDSEAGQVTAVDIFSRQILENPERPPSVLVGAWRSAVSVPLAILTGVYEIPQMSPLSTSTELDDVTQYTHFTRLIPSDAGTARATVDYFRDRSPDLRHLGVLYVNDAYGSAFHQAIKESAQAITPAEDRINVKGSPFSYNNAVLNPDEIYLAVKTLAESGYKVFFGVFYDEHYEFVMEAAMKFGIAGPGYVWIISDGLSETFLNNRAYPAGSDLAIASQGIGILKAEGGRETAEGNTGYDRFVKEWYSQPDSTVDYYNCVGHPADNTIDDASIYYQAEPGFFTERRQAPTAGSAFLYDSIMALGLAACGILDDAAPGTYFTGSELFDAVVMQSFEGASGNVAIDPATTSRDPTSAFFVLYNADGTTDGDETIFAVETVSHTSRTQDPNSTMISWLDMEGKNFIFSDGTTTFPPPLPPIEHNYNYLSPGVRAAGITMAGLVFATALFFSWWTFHHRKTRVVRASQPMFLQMIIAGSVLMAATNITLSFDDRVAGQAGLNAACMLSPWFLAYGFVFSFSSLFSKTWRVNKIFHNPKCRRVKVTTKDVILPFLMMFTLNTLVLAVWTAMSPLQWVRIDRGGFDSFNRSTASYGTCHADTREWAPFLAILLALNFSMIILANVQAYRAREITTEYAESKFIGIIMASILQACVIGLPLIVIVADEPVANYIVRSGLIFVICISMLLLMFVPKMGYLKQWKAERRNKERLKRDRAIARERAMERAISLGYGKSTALRAAGAASGDGTGNTTDSTAKTSEGFTVSMKSNENRRVSELGENSSHGDHEYISSQQMNAKAQRDAFIAVDEKSYVPKVAGLVGVTAAAISPLKNTPDKGNRDGNAMIENERQDSTLNIDEELAIFDAVEGRQARNVDLNGIEDDYDNEVSLGDLSSYSSMTEDGCLRIINHPKEEKKEVRLLKAQLEHMKVEKLELYDKIQGLRSLLRNHDISDYEEELETLVTSHSEVRRSSERETSLTDNSVNRALDRTMSEASRGVGQETFSRPKMKAFASVRFSPAGMKKMASVRFGSLSSLGGSKEKLGSSSDLNADHSAGASSKSKVGWHIDIECLPSDKNMDSNESLLEAGGISSNGNLHHSGSNLDKINEDNASEESSHVPEPERCETSLPQAPDLSPVDVSSPATTATETCRSSVEQANTNGDTSSEPL